MSSGEQSFRSEDKEVLIKDINNSLKSMSIHDLALLSKLASNISEFSSLLSFIRRMVFSWH